MICIILLVKNRKEKEIVDDQYENDFIITPNNCIVIKPRETILR